MATDTVDSSSPQTSAPATVDSARAVDSGPDYHPSQDDAAGLTAFREVLASRAEPAPETPPSPPPDPAASPESVPVPGSDEPLSPEDKRLERVLTRITRLEDDRKAAQTALAERDAELTKLRDRAKLADEYENNISRFREDPDALFRMVRWDAEKIRDYVANGPSKVDAATSQLSREQAELKARLDKYEQAEAVRTQADRVATFKAGLPRQLEGVKDTPLTLAFYETPTELADALFGVMDQTYRTQNKELTALEAAKVIETTLGSHFERLSRARSKQNPATPSTPTKPTTPTLTNVPPAPASKPNGSTEDSDEDLLAAATAAFRASRRASA